MFEAGLGTVKDLKSPETQEHKASVGEIFLAAADEAIAQGLGSHSLFKIPTMERTLLPEAIVKPKHIEFFPAITNELMAKGEAANKAIPADKQLQEKEKVK